MVITGALLSPFVALDALTTPSYWSPITTFNWPVGIEGLLFTFFITGIAAVVYQIFFKKRYYGGKLRLSLSLVFIVPAIAAALAVYFLKVNIIYLFIFGFTFMACSEIILRRDLLLNSVFTSVIFATIYVITFSIWLFLSPESIEWWNTPELTGLRVGGVPIEEVLFSLSLGLFVGPLYQFLTGGRQITSPQLLEK
jgi:hypothetical protein